MDTQTQAQTPNQTEIRRKQEKKEEYIIKVHVTAILKTMWQMIIEDNNRNTRLLLEKVW